MTDLRPTTIHNIKALGGSHEIIDASRLCFIGFMHRFMFDNGFGISVVKHDGSYGHEQDLWEIAVLDSNGDLCYKTPVTDDVLGWLTDSDVYETAVEVAALDPNCIVEEEPEEPDFRETISKVNDLMQQAMDLLKTLTA